MFAYTSYAEIPNNIREYVANTAGLDFIDDLALVDINRHLNEAAAFYTANGLKIEDFLDD